MKAITFKKYGPPEVLQLNQVAKPIPKDNEVLIRIFATAVNSGDIRLRNADPWAVRLFLGLSKPRINILGGVLSGEVEAIGKNVTKFNIGDQLFGSTGMSFGAYADYKCLPENGILAIKPANITHQQAATIPFGATTALYFLKKAGIKSGQKVLIYGASGAVGSSAVQLAKFWGAEVTGVCSTSNIGLVRSLGADGVIDYTKKDFTTNGETYDLIFETVNKLSFSASIKSLKKNGTLILGASGLSQQLRGVWTSRTSSQKIISGMIKQKAEDIIFLKELIEREFYKPVVDRTYPLEQMVEAHTYAEQGHKRGNVAITLT
ncbi:NAD(P)-dependent alcohol dehydrogenase [soil metagenome]